MIILIAFSLILFLSGAVSYVLGFQEGIALIASGFFFVLIAIAGYCSDIYQATVRNQYHNTER